MNRHLTADRGDAGRRLDLVLRRHLADVDEATRTRVQAWIESGQVTVNGTTIRRVSGRVAFGDLVSILLPEQAARRKMEAEDVGLDILYEDDHLLAINKPAGLVVHPTFAHASGTLMNALLWHARGWPVPQRPSIVGRLDKLTSGIVVVAKSAAIHSRLQRAFSATATSSHSEKDYLAVVYGHVRVARGEIDLRLRHDRQDRRRIVASATAGAASLTRFERLARVAAPRVGLALLRCRLVTGRRHQIRVHLAARGWPIVGDPAYGEPHWSRITDVELAAALRAFPRQALHARRVLFVHPITRGRLVVEAPLPRDFEDLLTAAGLSAVA
ncbi:MAG TPA: RluA family pseudouridine synthase [Vicinamibacterales bacterium]|nr:RluA family pseudouridine synthase [Vicinamibacterales bacterium]